MSTDLPPEAFTKKTLQDAFNWLQDQPEPVKASVHTPERLVSLFRKSQRLDDQDAPVSSKKFLDDLKSLATSLDQFNPSPSRLHDFSTSSSFQESVEFLPPPPSTSAATIETYSPPSHRVTSSRPISEPEATTAPPSPDYSGRSHSTETETETHKASLQFTRQRQKTTTQTPGLDPASLERVAEVRKRFNLGSDQEALRLLISLGFEKFSQFP